MDIDILRDVIDDLGIDINDNQLEDIANEVKKNDGKPKDGDKKDEKK